MSSKTKILVIDDNPSVIQLLQQVLEDENFDVITAERSLSGITALKDYDGEIKLVLCDIDLPDTSGFETIKIIRDTPEISSVPIIIITAFSDDEDIIKGLDLGANDYLGKPLNTGVLLARIRNQLRIKQLHDEIIESNEVISQKNIELEKLNNLKDDFLGMAAHDLRSPLSVIKMYCDYIINYSKEPLPDRVRDYLMQIFKTSNNMLALINDILDATAIESGNIDLRLQELSLDKFLIANFEQNKILASQKDINMELLLADEEIFATFDPDRMNQVMNNLISNAVKFSFPESNIYVGLKKEDEQAIIFVKDEGQGIPEDELGILFVKFKKTSVKPTGNEGSTGLGLPIVKKIMGFHGGQVNVESIVGEGSNFEVSLPLKKDGRKIN